ncbi:MAG: hypothetical protein WC509_03760 [Candidatus Izemoplasmatales bacterium]
MIERVRTPGDIRRFVRFQIDLYRFDPHFVPPILSVFTKEMDREILKARRAVGLLWTAEGRVEGRLFYAFAHDEKHGREVCWFSNFECVDDQAVADALFGEMEADMRTRGVLHAEGTYAPHDPDTRRGILVDGFDDDPAFLTSYNKPYYARLLENAGYAKTVDTVAVAAEGTAANYRTLSAIAERFDRKHDVRIDALSWRNLERDLDDVHAILARATTEMNYQRAPSLDMIRSVAESLRLFLDPKLVLIARREDSGEAVGFVFVMPDFNEVLKRTRGRIRPLAFLILRNRIRRVRGTLQYVVPEMQNTGLVFRMYFAVFERMRERGMTRLEGGTIVLGNFKSYATFLKLGGRIAKTFRLYGKDLTP